MQSSKMRSNLVFEQGISDFSFSIYDAIDKNGNELISPYSISSALLLLMLGTDGSTNNQMMNVIFKDQYPTNVHQGYKDLNDKLLESTGSDVTLAVANRLFGSQTYSLLDSYTFNALRYYGSGIELLDFVTMAEQARERINSWVSIGTTNKIQNIIPSGVLNANTVVVLANAVYFKGSWKTKFDQRDTKKTTFYASTFFQKQVDMMNGKFKAATGESLDLSCKILMLPYKGEKLSMIFILPNEIEGLGRMEKQLTQAKFDSLLLQLRQQETIIQIPKFMVEAEYDLIPILKRLGITEIFDDRVANFSMMVSSDVRGLYVSDARHKTYIEVDEEGSEAAAAATVVVDVRGGQPFRFDADHPFVFIIRDNITGTILFIGRFTGGFSV